jgi:hypothetical protein
VCLRSCGVRPVIPAVAHPGQIRKEGRGDRNGPGLVVLRGAPDQTPPYLRDALDDVEPAPVQVDARDPQRGQLAEPDPGERQHADGQPTWTGRLHEGGQLGNAEEAWLTTNRPRKPDTSRRVACDPSVLHRHTHDQREHTMDVPDGRGRPARGACLPHPRGDVGGRDGIQPVGAPTRFDVGPDDPAVSSGEGPWPGAGTPSRLGRHPRRRSHLLGRPAQRHGGRRRRDLPARQPRQG